MTTIREIHLNDGTTCMTIDDKLRIKKDMWWEIREVKAHIACVKQSIEKDIELLDSVVQAWKSGALGIDGNRLIKSSQHNDPSEVIHQYPSYEAFSEKCQDLEAAKNRLLALEDKFNQLLS
ncbi:MAG: hypothetical protein OXG05_03850 [Gammaproteobacteria bacterium]|nr:hypothetical protein [Gammaproteobacteria bacterium]